MILNLHAATLLFTNSIVALAFAVLALNHDAANQGVKAKAASWGWAMALLSSANFFWFLAVSPDSWLSWIGNCLYAVAPLAIAGAIANLTEKVSPVRWVWALAVTGVIGASLVWLGGFPRYFASAPIGLTFLICLAWSGFHILRPHNQRVSLYHLILSVTFGVTALVCLFRIVVASSGNQSALIPLAPSLLQSISALASLLVITMGSTGVLGILEDLRRRQIIEEGEKDGLTRVLMRKPFMEQSRALYQGQNNACAVLMLDIDNFKIINDTYGHAAGDAVITDCAQTITGNTRPGDLIGRIGGEEFAVFLPNCSLEVAGQVSERIRLYIEQSRPAPSQSDLRYTVSIGVATSSVSEKDGLTSMLHHADEALYTAKKKGKNQVKVHQDGSATP